MEEVKAILEGLKSVMTKLLQEQVSLALQDGHSAIVNSAMPMPNSPSVHKETAAVIARFAHNFGANFDALVGVVGVVEKPVNVLDYASLSLVEEDDLEAIIAMEGMISHARNCDVPQYIKFNTRLDSMLFGTRIDESNNPMDPEQIGEAFQEALRPVGLPAKNLLAVYRKFNIHVFHKLEVVLEEANDYLASRGVMEDLDVAARDKKMLLNKRSKQREKCDPTDRAFRTAAAPSPEATHAPDISQPDLPEGDEHLLEVDNYTIGLWFEFQVDNEHTIRCTLAAKIETIEKFVFVNSQGVKVIEKSRMGLARELQAGTVKVNCDGPLIDRAMESVIAQLRDARTEAA